MNSLFLLQYSQICQSFSLWLRYFCLIQESLSCPEVTIFSFIFSVKVLNIFFFIYLGLYHTWKEKQNKTVFHRIWGKNLIVFSVWINNCTNCVYWIAYPFPHWAVMPSISYFKFPYPHGSIPGFLCCCMGLALLWHYHTVWLPLAW